MHTRTESKVDIHTRTDEHYAYSCISLPLPSTVTISLRIQANFEQSEFSDLKKRPIYLNYGHTYRQVGVCLQTYSRLFTYSCSGVKRPPMFFFYLKSYSTREYIDNKSLPSVATESARSADALKPDIKCLATDSCQSG